ncbi:MAG: hypothetical protein SGARI_001682 [Bacillariaceae sp.]
MCIGIKPVFSPLQAEVDLNHHVLRETVVDTISPAAVSRSASSQEEVVSRKRPLHEEQEDVVASFSQQQQPNRKMMRYSSCTFCKQQQQLNNKSERKVQFGGFTTLIPAAHSLSEQDREKLWYGLDECAAMNEASRIRVKALRSKENKDMLRHVLCVASQCLYSPPPLAYLQMVRLHFDDDTRGLELGLLPLRIRQRRQEHVKKIIEVQTHIKSGKIPLKNNKNKERVKAKALAIQSLRSSQASKLFAEVLARNVATDLRDTAGDTAAVVE